MLYLLFDLFNPKTKLARKHSSEEEAQKIASVVVQETNKLLKEYQLKVSEELHEIKAQLRQIDTNIELIERKINIQDMLNKQQIGQLHYKLHEVPNNKLVDEIGELKKALHSKRAFPDN